MPDGWIIFFIALELILATIPTPSKPWATGTIHHSERKLENPVLSEISIPNPSKTPDAPKGSKRKTPENCEIDFDLFVNKYAATKPSIVAIVIAKNPHINEL